MIDRREWWPYIKWRVQKIWQSLTQRNLIAPR